MKIEKLHSSDIFPSDWTNYDFHKLLRNKINEIIDARSHDVVDWKEGIGNLIITIRNLENRIESLENPVEKEKEIKPCPFCKGTARVYGAFKVWRMVCIECGASSGISETKDFSIMLWNESV